jgi:DNA-binding MarR family transcriptional regulator
MEKRHLEQFYQNIADMKEEYKLFSFTLPMALIYRKIYSLNEQLIKEKYGLITSDLDVLAALNFHGKELSPTELYNTMIFSSGGMTKVLKKLESLSYISRVASPEDKRSTLVKLEPEGETLLLKCLDDIVEQRADIFDILDETEKDTLKCLLKKLSLNLF